jgi:enamine deaminase RidA (YjgF/YER057c/UK114 family)
MKTERIVLRNHVGGASSGATQAVRAGNFIFVGGQMSLDGRGRVVGTDIATQAERAFDALKRVLKEAGAGMADVVKHNVYIDYQGDDAALARFMDQLDEVRLAHFTDPGPTTTEICAGLDREGALLQVEAVAAIGLPKQRLMPDGHWRWGRKLPFSQGWKVGDLVFVGGQRSLDGDGRLVGVGDIAVQTANAFGSVEKVLKAAGGDRTNLMRQNTYYRFLGEGHDVTDYWEKMTRVRMQHWPKPTPCGTGVRVRGFPLSEELIQTEGIGVLGSDKQRLMPANHWDWSIRNNDFTQGWRNGEFVFIGGQISADDKARAVGGDLASQTRNVYRFIRNTLREAGCDERDVIKLNSYYYATGDSARLAEAAATMGRIQKEFYPEPGPAATTVKVTGFAFEELLVEIEAIAVMRG